MNLKQLGKLPSTVHENNCQQALRSTIPLSISSEERVLCKFSAPRDDGRDESRMERVRCLGPSPGGTDVSGTDQIVIGRYKID